MKKPTVTYDNFEFFHVCVGHSAVVMPVDHPNERVSNATLVKTSKVVSYSKSTGIFETEHTKYVPLYNGGKCNV